MNINDFGHKSFVTWTTGLIERVKKMEFEELKSLLNKIGNIPQDEFLQLSVIGYLYGRRYSDQLPDAAPEKEIEQFMDYATNLHLFLGLFTNVLNGHIAVTFEGEEPAFHITAVGKRYTEENILKGEGNGE